MGTVIIDNPLTIVQQAEASGKKITTGVYQTGPAIIYDNITITHGLGVKPNIFIFTANLPATESRTTFVLYINPEVYPTVYSFIKYTGNGTTYAVQNGQTLPTNITETQITISPWNPTYKFASDTQYTWIAIE